MVLRAIPSTALAIVALVSKDSIVVKSVRTRRMDRSVLGHVDVGTKPSAILSMERVRALLATLASSAKMNAGRDPMDWDAAGCVYVKTGQDATMKMVIVYVRQVTWV